MDVARLSLTIDGQPAVKEVSAVEAALMKLPASAATAAAQVTAALNGIKAAAQGMQTVQVNVNNTTQQAAAATVNYSAALQQIQMQLSQTNALLNASVNATNSLRTAMAQATTQTQTLTASTGQVAAATGGMNLSFGNTLRIVGQLVGIQFGAAALRELVVGSVQASIGMQRLENTFSAVHGSVEAAAREIAFLRVESDRIGVVFTTTAQAYAKFEAALIGGPLAGKARDIFIPFAEAGQRLHLSEQQMGSVFLALEQMASKGVVSMEELRRQLGNVLPGAFNIASRAMGVTTQEMNRMVREGKVLAEDLIPKMAEEIRKTFPLGDAASQTVAELSRVKNAWQELQQTIGKELPLPLSWVRKLTESISAGIKLTNTQTLQDMMGGNEAAVVNYLHSQFPAGPDVMDASPSRTPGLYKRVEKPGTFNPFTGGQAPGTVSYQLRTLSELLPIYEGIQRTQEGVIERNNRLVDQMKAGYAKQYGRTETDDAETAAKAHAQLSRLLVEEATGYDKLRLSAALWYQQELEKTEKMGVKDPATRAQLYAGALGGYQRRMGDVQAKEAADAMEQLEAFAKAKKAEIDAISAIDEKSGGVGGGKEAAVKRINDLYVDRQGVLSGMVRMDAENAAAVEAAQMRLDQWKTDALAKTEAEFARRFVGEGNVNELVERRKQLELELLSIHQDDPAGADRAQQIQREMRDLNQTIALQFQTNGVDAATAFQFGWKQVMESWGNDSQQMLQLGATVAQSLDTNFTNAFTRMLLMQKDVAAGFHEMTTSIVADIARIMVQQQISQPIAQAIMGAFGAFAGAGASSGTVSAGGAVDSSGFFQSNHRGGIVGMGGETRTVSLASFHNAPRYHGGGVIGDEVPVIARRGEKVLTPEQDAARTAREQRAASVTVINVTDPNAAQREFAAKPDAFVNLVSANSRQIKLALGMR